MAHLLADETLADILTRHLHVTDDAFASTDPYAVASDNGWCSSSQVLLVCKRWLRVATPLLYDVIILRSAAQAQSLALALKKTPQLGAFIRKVRLEGGFGANVQKFLALAPNVTDLVLNLTIWSNDSTTGICKALSSMNPRKLVLVHLGTEDRRQNRGRDQENKNEAKLRGSLEAALPKWTNMTCVTLEVSRLCGDDTRFPPLANVLLQVPNLQKLHVWIHWGFPGWEAHIMPLAAQRRILRVVLHASNGYALKSAREVLEGVCKIDPKAAEKVFIEEHTETKHVALSPFDLRRQFAIELPRRITMPQRVDYVPLQNATSEVQERVWTLILSNAVHDEFHKFRIPNLSWLADADRSLAEDFVDDIKTVHYAANYMYVCKRFLCIVRRLVCRHLQLKNRTALVQAAAFLRKDASLPPLVETIRLGGGVSEFYGPGGTDFVCGTSGAAEQADVVSILSSATRLHELTLSGHLPPAAWKVISATVTTIKTVCASYTKAATLAANTLAPFRALQTLDWFDGRTEFSTSGVPGELPQLETLVLRSQTPSFVDVLSRIKLPAIRRVEWRFTQRCNFMLDQSLERFFKAHGNKFTSVYIEEETPFFLFGLCPNLTRLELSRADPRMVSIFGKHDKLAMITVEARFFGNDPSAWKEFFDSFALAAFPALREFHTREPNIETWPTDEHAVAKFPWTAWGELLLTHGVQLIHHRAGAWKPRLKAVKPKRNSAGKGGQE